MIRPVTFALVLLCGNAAMAQHVVSAKAGMIHDINGTVYLDDTLVQKDSHGLRVKGVSGRFPQMKDGQRHRTAGGREEILLNPAAFLRLDGQSSIRMDSTHLEDTSVTVNRGIALFEILDVSRDDSILVHFGKSTTEFKRGGLYLFDGSSATLRVFGGEADITVGKKSVRAKRGMAVQLDDGLGSSKFDLKSPSAFLDWAADRSFLLYNDPTAYDYLTNWKFVGAYTFWNEDFGVQRKSYEAGEHFATKEKDQAAHEHELDEARRKAEAELAARQKAEAAATQRAVGTTAH